MKIKTVNKLWGKVIAISLPPFICFVRKDKLTDKLIKHEQAHFDQAKQDGYIKFYFRYLWQGLTKGYNKIDYEIEANNAENN